jgi:gliding motility-associated lipoprotein GldH
MYARKSIFYETKTKSYMKPFILFFLSLCLIGCQDERALFSEHQKFDGELEWKKSDIKSFEVDLPNIVDQAEVMLSFRCATGYFYNVIWIKMTETSPSGKKQERILEIPVRDAKGEFYGEKGFDIVDIDMILDSAKTFDEKGKWTYAFEQAMDQVESLDFPMELGLTVRKPK